ncbi:hypothetical protein IGS74_17950 [Aureimonas sp. OT7]|uniref:hypothetical protein n=1 Tax=Aureimonas sp. OT7 TaxID=2816454 RepID=UPI001780A000|nr:hypothetical protein [Aureimonas sp. OT7]QOG06385.1 hypothetical protein IGS74_17950 [Aureimonas sp. OT7]
MKYGIGHRLRFAGIGDGASRVAPVWSSLTDRQGKFTYCRRVLAGVVSSDLRRCWRVRCGWQTVCEALRHASAKRMVWAFPALSRLPDEADGKPYLVMILRGG